MLVLSSFVACIPGALSPDLRTLELLLIFRESVSHVQALWVRFTPDPQVADPDTWGMSKLGSLVSPTDIVRNGSHSMHGVDDDGVLVRGLGHKKSWEQLRIRCAQHLQPTPSIHTCLGPQSLSESYLYKAVTMRHAGSAKRDLPKEALRQAWAR